MKNTVLRVDRKQAKSAAKVTLKRNYLVLVFTCLLAAFLGIAYTGSLTALKAGAGRGDTDTVAASVAAALGAALITCFEQPGVLRDRQDPSSVIPSLDKAAYAALKAQGAVADGMIPKLDQAFDALESGAAEVRICHSRALLTGEGTLIK